MKKNRVWLHVGLISFALLASLILGYESRWADSASAKVPPEINAALDTPDRGFYEIHYFYIEDEMDCAGLVEDSFAEGSETELVLLEINLQDYCRGEISEAGLQNIDALFDALRTLNKRYILRFVYDWDGENLDHEPEKLSVVLRHMEQLGSAINRNRARIFTLQGVLVGNWGEMNGTRYTGATDWRALAEKLAAVTDSSVYLSVRTPQQRRCAVGSAQTPVTFETRGGLAVRLGLFNDGMLGSESDVGTYGDAQRSAQTYGQQWTRADELAYQNELCRFVPNGGEVIRSSAYNDFEQAVDTMRTMHVSYLNREYDGEVLDKWAAYRISNGSIWDGMDGLTYIERHLGYRYVLRDAALSYVFWSNQLHAELTLANEGFAPAYRDIWAELVFVDKNGIERGAYRLDGNLRALSGERGETLTLDSGVSLGNLPRGDYDIYLRLYSDYYAKSIPLANGGWNGEWGCRIGALRAKSSFRN